MLKCKEILRFIKKHHISIILSLIIILQAAQIVYWIIQDNQNPSQDEAWHLSNTISYKNKIFNLDYPSNEALSGAYPIFKFAYSIYPHPNPFYFIGALLPNEYNSILIIQLLFITILILSVYGIGKNLFGVNTGLLSAFLISTCPIALQLTHKYYLDLPLTSFVALSIFLLIKTQLFQNNKYNLLFILSLILGTLTKQTFPLFVFPAITYFLAIMFISKSISTKNKTIFSILIGLAILTISLLVYLCFPERTLLMLKTFFTGFHNLLNISGYLKTLIKSQISPLYFIALIIGSLYFFKKSKYRVLMLLLLTPIPIMIMMEIALARYTFSLIIPPILIISAGINHIKINNLKKAAISILLLLGLLQFISLAFLAETQTSPTDIKLILEQINHSPINNKSICIIAENVDVNDINIPYYSIKYNYNLSYVIGNGCDPNKFNFIILGPISKSWRSNLFESSKALFLANKTQFEKIGNVSKIEIYRKINQNTKIKI
jgi:4-amino-4-deoxy-L-arabinose transferase-like glycosyltransferase